MALAKWCAGLSELAHNTSRANHQCRLALPRSRTEGFARQPHWPVVECDPDTKEAES